MHSDNVKHSTQGVKPNEFSLTIVELEVWAAATSRTDLNCKESDY